MASVQEAEVLLAQRLASNEKPVRSRAMKKLRKYISVRSQRAAGGFSGDELLKLWKGLFYCLWMQDKPLLQEELSKVICGLIHSFHSVDSQFLFLESFLQTLKREWTGIDRLRMDKFFQLVRFMFRQTFEMLKRRNWDSSVVGRFLELLTAQLLQSGSAVPSGLQLHVLDLYMTELAALGSDELSADQNLTFIEPFCKTAAKTKDRTLFGAICSSIFSAIIDQAPYAIDDLMKELKAADGSDSGQASEEEEEEEEPKKAAVKKDSGKQMNGRKSHKNDDDEDDFEDDDEDDDLLHLEESDSELPDDEDIGPVLQFDYSALADKLFVLASRNNTPSQNRQRLYKIIKVLRDLSEGVFPQDEYPEEVSTDEDDDMFASRKRMKRGAREEEGDDGAPAAKKKKGKKKESSSSSLKQNETADVTSNDEKKKKKKKRKKKKKKTAAVGEGEGEQEQSADNDAEADPQTLSSVKVTEAEVNSEKASQEATATATPLKKKTKKKNQKESTSAEETSDVTEPKKKEKKTTAAAGQADSEETSERDQSAGKDAAEDPQTLNNVSSVKVTDATTTEPLLLLETKKQPTVTVTDTEDQHQTTTTTQEQPTVDVEATTETPEPEVFPETDAAASGKKKRKKQQKKEEEEVVESGLETAEIEAEASPQEEEITPETNATTSAKKKKKKGQKKTEETEVSPEEASSQETTTTTTPLKKKTNKKKVEEETDPTPAATPLLKKRKKNQKESETPEVTEVTPAKKKKKSQQVAASAKPAAKKKKKIIPVTFEYEADEVAEINGLAQEEAAADVEEPSTPVSSKKTQKKAKTTSGSDFVTFQSDAAVPTPLFCKTKGGTPLSKKKKIQIPKSESKKVTFGLKNNKTAEFRKTDRSLLVSPNGSSRVPFDPQQKPKCGVLKSAPTLRSSSVKKTPNRKKSSTTPKSTPKRRPTASDFF